MRFFKKLSYFIANFDRFQMTLSLSASRILSDVRRRLYAVACELAVIAVLFAFLSAHAGGLSAFHALTFCPPLFVGGRSF